MKQALDNLETLLNTFNEIKKLMNKQLDEEMYDLLALLTVKNATLV